MMGPYRVFSLTWPASMQIYCNKRKRLHKKRVQLPQDWFGTPTWPPFHCFGTPIWPPWRHVKTLYRSLQPLLFAFLFFVYKGRVRFPDTDRQQSSETRELFALGFSSYTVQMSWDIWSTYMLNQPQTAFQNQFCFSLNACHLKFAYSLINKCMIFTEHL